MDNKQTTSPFTKSILHIPLFILSVIVAVAISQSTLVEQILAYGPASYTLAGLALGVMYSSFFTVAPATVGFFQLAAAGESPLTLAITGGIGAMIGDLSLFQIIKFSIIDDLVSYLQRRSQGAFNKVTKVKFVRYAMLIGGAIIMTTPLPDEIGLALMGLIKSSWQKIAILGFFLNAIGIYIIALLAS